MLFRSVPRILAAPGVVVATSNKRDVLDVTRAARAASGPVWVFDPQGIADEPQRFWWDPQAKLKKAGDVFRTGSEKTGADRRALLLGTLLLRQCFCQVRQ